MEDDRPGTGKRIEIDVDDPDSLPAGEETEEDDAEPTGDGDEEQAPDDGEQAGDEEAQPQADGPEDPAVEVRRLTELYEQEHDRHLRAVAELQNFRRRAAREQVERLQFANQELLTQLLPVLDNLERALAAKDKATCVEDIAGGVDLVAQEFRRALQAFGVERIEPDEGSFDPALHEAVARVETDEAAEGAILHVDAPGYRLHDRVLRPARVVVAAKRTD